MAGPNLRAVKWEQLAWLEETFELQLANGNASGLDQWQRARAQALAPLRRLGDAIAATKAPGADRLVILVRAIIKNLTPEPTTLQAVSELERYLREDEIIADAESPNPFGIKVALRQPLLQGLAGLKAELQT